MGPALASGNPGRAAANPHPGQRHKPGGEAQAAPARLATPRDRWRRTSHTRNVHTQFPKRIDELPPPDWQVCHGWHHELLRLTRLLSPSGRPRPRGQRGRGNGFFVFFVFCAPRGKLTTKITGADHMTAGVSQTLGRSADGRACPTSGRATSPAAASRRKSQAAALNGSNKQ